MPPKDDCLNWSDMKLIAILYRQMIADPYWAIRLIDIPDKEFYEELLKRFKKWRTDK